MSTDNILKKLKETSIKDTTWIKEANRRHRYRVILDIIFYWKLDWFLIKRLIKKLWKNN